MSSKLILFLFSPQALRHLKKHVTLFAAFTGTARSELALLNKIQEYCYDNMNFLKTFNKIVLLLYKTDVLSEEVILKWYKDSHSSRGWSVFMEQMKKFVEWLEHAEEGENEQAFDFVSYRIRFFSAFCFPLFVASYFLKNLTGNIFFPFKNTFCVGK